MSQVDRFAVAELLYKILEANSKKEVIEHIENYEEFDNVFYDKIKWQEIKEKHIK